MKTVSEIRRARRLRTGEEDEGFTLIELLVVLLIIGILLAIAIPTFLSVTKSANNTAAQSNLQTALTGANTYYTANNQSYSFIDSSSATVSNISAIDTGLTYVSGGGSQGPASISIAAGGNLGWLVLAAYANGTKDCWVIVDQKAAQTTAVSHAPLATGTYYGVIKNATHSSCVATSTMTLTTNPATGGFPAG